MQPREIIPKTFDLSIARVNERLNLGAIDMISVISVPDLAALFSMRFDLNTSPEHILETGHIFNSKDGQHFDTLYFSNVAGTGIVTLEFARGMTFERDLRYTSDMVQNGYKSQVVTVTDAATALPAAGLAKRIGLMLRNTHAANVVKLGGSTVSFATGFSLAAAGGVWSDKAATGAIVYGICDAGLTADVEIMESS